METIHRTSCRAIILTPLNEVLLININNPDGNWTGWITPGGGIDANESEETALKRELDEELGFRDFKIEGIVWKRFHEFIWNQKIISQHEFFFLIKTPRFIPAPSVNLSESEMLDFQGFRWWTLDEIKDAQNLKVEFSPRNFYSCLLDLIDSGVPKVILDVGI